MSGRVVIVGAGILGLATAHALQSLGVRDITIVDRTRPGSGASGRSGALVRANYENEVEARLALHSLSTYRAFAEAVGGDCGFLAAGLLVAVPPRLAQAYDALAERQRLWGVPIGPIDADAARELAPCLRTEDLGRILHQPDAGCCDPNTTLASYVQAVAMRGARFAFGDPVLRILYTGERARGVATRDGSLEADAVVLAAGVWLNDLLPRETRLGLVPQLTRVAVFRPDEFKPGLFPTLIDVTQDAWYRPMPVGAILVGSESGVEPGIDPARIPSTAPNDLVESYRDVLVRRFGVSRDAAPRGAWAGAFMLSPDHRPVIGQLPGHERLFIAGGDSGGAFKTAPGLALALAEEIVLGAARSFDVGALSPARLLPPSASAGAGGAMAGTVSR